MVIFSGLHEVVGQAISDGWKGNDTYQETKEMWQNGFRSACLPVVVLETVCYWPAKGLRKVIPRIGPE